VVKRVRRPAESVSQAATVEVALESRAAVSQLCLVVALASAAILLVEIAITRILSVVLWYHFAFLAISLAMLGIGGPGVWFALRRPPAWMLPAALIAAGIALPLSVVAIFQWGRPLKDIALLFPGLSRLLNPELMFIIAAILVPFLCLGAVVCLCILGAPRDAIGIVYGADLLGGTVASLLVIPLLWIVPTPLLVAGAGVLPLAAAALVAPRARIPVAVLGVGLVALLAWGEPFKLHYTKNYEETATVVYERWTPTARLTVHDKPFFEAKPENAFGWGFGAGYAPPPHEQMWLEQDGSAGTPLTRVTGPVDGPDLDHLFHDVTSIGYQLHPSPKRVCVIGAGGGRDILTALRAGAESVDAVELNPGVIDVANRRFGDFTGHVYGMPRVHAVASEGRSFLTRSAGNYDVIQIALIDSWAATAAGAFALSENYLYTTEALRLYWRRLSDDGHVSITRYAQADRVHEVLRLCLLAHDALLEQGITRPGEHLMLAHAGGIATLLMTRRAIDAATFARYDSLCRTRGFSRDWPLAEGETPRSLTAQILAAPGIETERQWIDVTPTTDDRPFFFQTVPVFGAIHAKELSRMSSNENSVLLLRGLLIVMLGLAAVLYLLPFAVLRRPAQSLSFWQGSSYFFAIGLAFMLCETSWVQRFILFLGHPSYAASVVIATLLLAAGIGSLAASRVPLAMSRRLFVLLPVVAAAVGLVAGPVFGAAIGLVLPVRIAISCALLAPVGFLMGLGFPCGMMTFTDGDRAWFWAMNGVASVAATVGSLALAMTFGLQATGFIGAALYAVAALLMIPARTPAGAPPLATRGTNPS
jgi:hypothetical protein